MIEIEITLRGPNGQTLILHRGDAMHPMAWRSDRVPFIDAESQSALVAWEYKPVVSPLVKNGDSFYTLNMRELQNASDEARSI